MNRFVNFLLLLALICHLHIAPSVYAATPPNAAVSAPCPLDFSVLRRLDPRDGRWPSNDTRLRCQNIGQGLHLVLAEYLRSNGSFLPPIESAEPCWEAYDLLVGDFIPGFDIRRGCGFQTDWIAQGCMNITTRVEFEAHVTPSVVDRVVGVCNESLLDNCASCVSGISNMQSSLPGPYVGNLTDCTAFSFIYVAAFGNSLGPTDQGTAECLFSLYFTPSRSRSRSRTVAIAVAAAVAGSGLVLGFLGFWYLRRRKQKLIKQRWRNRMADMNLNSGLESISESTTLIRFTFDEIKAATKNFSRDNIIGQGGYGNVYKGVLPDGSEVALKRFRNCSTAEDPNFTHEVEVIASIRHVNLVALRGYCMATTPLEGHQRLIVYDLMKNGSVHDHLFGLVDKRLSWPVRQRIAIGTAKGLEYLHYGAQPAIIHRDIKASNILLDERFEAKVADFGLAKFTPEGMTHLSTRVAGTIGYLAPEYALYGQLTERSDVHSFGIVLLELLSGKKALISGNDEQPTLLADWAWSLVGQGRVMDVIEEGMTELGPPEVVEKYVLVGILCSHPHLSARPTMDQVVKMLDSGMPVPPIPERPISLFTNMDDIQWSVSGSRSGHVFNHADHQLQPGQGQLTMETMVVGNNKDSSCVG